MSDKTKPVSEVVEEFERRYGAFKFTCPETDTISKPQMRKYTDWLHQTLTERDEAVRAEERKKVKHLIDSYFADIAYGASNFYDLEDAKETIQRFYEDFNQNQQKSL